MEAAQKAEEKRTADARILMENDENVMQIILEAMPFTRAGEPALRSDLNRYLKQHVLACGRSSAIPMHSRDSWMQQEVV
ncbi:hypothetical protein ATY81_26505 [Rhizobium sp. R72]|nr:hypothetical protein ATY81_26505 [Rhizobium sp. R72]OWV98951.1 hypothetical protein ATY80_26505 [Rhizobium sp. R711]